MNGPSKSDIKQLRRFDWMEVGIVFAGLLVVGGLLMESWPEIKRAIAECRFPNLTVTGGIIVTVGVLAEVVLGIFITQRANRAQSEANERVAKAEQAASEADLERVRIEHNAAARGMTPEQRIALAKKLVAFSGQRCDITVYPVSFETNWIAENLRGVLESAHWVVSPITYPATPPKGLIKQGVRIETTGDADSSAAGKALLMDLLETMDAAELHPSPLPDAPHPRVWILVGDKPSTLRQYVRQSRPVTPPQA